MKKRISLIVCLVMLLSLCGCGAESQDRAAEAPMAMAAPKLEMQLSADMAVTEEAAYGGFAVNSAAATGAVAENGGEQAPTENPDKIIYSADATVETTDFDGSLAGLEALVAEYGGWVESSSINGANYYNMARGRVSTRSAYYSLRIPSQHFDALMSGLSTLGNVPYSHTYTENITAQYYDTEARLTAYETQEARLLEMLEIAESVEDIIAIEEKLTELRYKIESLQTSLRNWDRQVSYSSVYINLEEVEEYTPEAIVRPSYGEKLVEALEGGIAELVGFIGDLFIWFVTALPSLIVIGTLAVVLVVLIKRRKNKKKAGKNSSGEEK